MADSTSGGGTVRFNVGGHRFLLFSSTLTKHPDCLLTHLASDSMRTITDSDGAICIDRDPSSFENILSYLRYDIIPAVAELSDSLVKRLCADAKFYRLPQLYEALEIDTRSREQEKVTANSVRELDENSEYLEQEIVDLNIGGTQYTVSLNTLQKYSDSMLGAMFRGTWPAARRDSTGRYFIDRDGMLFRYVLNFMRSGVLRLPDDFVEFKQLMAEADFYQIGGLQDAIRELRMKRAQPRESGIYLEVKDTMVWFRGFHINTSLVGPLQHLQQLSPFREEFDKCIHEGPSRFNIEPFYTSWSKGIVEEIYLNFQHSKSRLEWAMLLKAAGWRLLGSSVCCSSSNDQTFITVDKWFYQTNNLPPELFNSTRSNSTIIIPSSSPSGDSLQEDEIT